MASTARTIPTGCHEQPGGTDTIDTSGVRTFSSEVKGSYTDLETWMNTFVIGEDTYKDRVIKARSLRRVAGDLGVLTITTGVSDTTSEEGDQNAYRGVWSFHAARNDTSVLAYCGSAASRICLEMWQKETDSDLASAYKYKDDTGVVHELNETEKLIAGKIASGKDTVIRFYPILTFTAYYKSCPKNWATDIGLIRTPAALAADKIETPDNINNVIGGFVWLKVQDDVDEMPDNEFKRVMSWWGVRSAEGGWDSDFYGYENRWSMPISAQS